MSGSPTPCIKRGGRSISMPLKVCCVVLHHESALDCMIRTAPFRSCLTSVDHGVIMEYIPRAEGRPNFAAIRSLVVQQFLCTTMD